MEHLHQRPEPGEYSEFYGRYIARVPAGDMTAILAQQMDALRKLLGAVPPDGEEHAYAPGKWTIREVVGHVCDTERVMSYRALRIARGDTTPLPGFDENAFVAGASFGERRLQDLVDELTLVRAATIALLRGLPSEAWTRQGTASAAVVTVRALAAIIAGHDLHHRDLLETRYLLTA